MLGTLVALLALPWLTSTGCSGDKPPVTWSGYELMAISFGDEPLFLLAPLALLLSTLLLIVGPRIVSAGRRAWLSALMFALTAAGSFFLLVAVEVPRAGDVVEHHFASFAGSGALIALVLEALVRLVLGVREWWLARRARRAASSSSAPSPSTPAPPAPSSRS
jgi:hypothetical protein